MSWTFAGNSQSLTLPNAPRRVRVGYYASTKEYMMPTLRSLLISFGRKADKLTIEGALVNSAMTNSQMEAAYLTKFRAMVYHDITIGAPDARYDDEHWILVTFEFEERGGQTEAFYYKLEFMRGVTGAGAAPGIVIT